MQTRDCGQHHSQLGFWVVASTSKSEESKNFREKPPNDHFLPRGTTPAHGHPESEVDFNVEHKSFIQIPGMNNK